MDTVYSLTAQGVRTVELHTPFSWLRAGLSDLRSAPLPSLFYGMCFALIGYALLFALRHEPQLLASASAGFLLLGPALALGLYDLSRRREAGLPMRLAPTLMAWRNNFVNLALFCTVLMVIFLVWVRASLITFGLSFPGGVPTMEDLLLRIVAMDHWGFLAVWLGIGFLFATVAFLISVITMQMLLDRQTDILDAVLTSLQVAAANPGPLAVWAAIIAWATSAALLMGFVGVIVVVPLLGHASWHAYRSMVGQ